MKSFLSFQLDQENHSLFRGEERLQITLKSFDVLCYLVGKAGSLVTQDELLDALWPKTYVNPEVLRKYILEIRRVLGDRPEKPIFIETVTKRGYRFIAPVVDESEDEPPELSTPRAGATEEAATEEQVRRETVLSDQETPPAKHRMSTHTSVLLLAVV